MLVSNNDEEPEEAPVEPSGHTKRPGGTHVNPSRRLQVAPAQVEVKSEDNWVRDAVHGLALSPKDPLAHEMACMLHPHTTPESNDDEAPSGGEDDEMPMLESERTSLATPQEPIMITASTEDEPVDRLSDSVPEGELHVWVYEARQLSAPWPMTDAIYDRDGLRVRCSLLGAVQESPCNESGNMSNPIWRQTHNEERDGKGGHFAWAVGQPEENNGDDACIGVEASECRLEIEVICGERIVGSASVALEDLLLSSKSHPFEADAADGSGSKVIRLSPHWLPLAGDSAGLLQISLEFLPIPLRESSLWASRSSNNQFYRSSEPQDNDEEDARQSSGDGTILERAQQRKIRFEPRELVEASKAVPWGDQRDAIPLQEQQENTTSKVIVSKSGAVTMYIPSRRGSSPSNPRLGSLQQAPAPKSMTSFGLQPGGEQERLMDKQLWDLYYFGISNEAPKDTRDSDGSLSYVSSTNVGVPRQSDASFCSRQASTCVSDVLAYNELIQDMECAMKSMKDNAPSPIDTSNQDQIDSSDQSTTETSRTKMSPTPKLRLKLRRLSLKQPLDLLQSFWHEAKARRSSHSSNDSNESNASPSNSKTRAHRKSSSNPGSSTSSPTAVRSRVNTPSQTGVILFDPQNLPVPTPYLRATSRDQALQAVCKAERARLEAANGPRRRSLPINQFSAQHRKEVLEQHLQQRRTKRSGHRQQDEPHIREEPSLLDSVDPPLLSRERSDSLHSLTDLYLPKTGVLHGVQATTTITSTTDTNAIAATRVMASSHAKVRRASGSNVVYINGQPLCVGKSIEIGRVPGVVRYIGPTRFATGTWVGIELREEKGKNSGTVDGEKYFSCAPNHGIFIRASRLDLSVQ